MNLQNVSPYVEINEIDFRENDKKGNIEYDDYGLIFYKQLEKKYLGFIFLKTYLICSKDKKENQFPKLHLTRRCEYADHFIVFMKLGDDRDFEFTNKLNNTVIDKDSKFTFENQSLNICKHCQQILFDKVYDDNTIIEHLKINSLPKITAIIH